VDDPLPDAAAGGQNSWLVDEMYQQYLADPDSVTESWRDFFSDYGLERPAPAPEAAAVEEEPPGIPLRGAAARVVQNMESSLTVPTATSFREIPAKLLEVNRATINGYLDRSKGGKVSFTHIIAWAVVRAIADDMPVMNSSYLADSDGKPRVIHHDHVGLGIAVDIEKSDGSRALFVPCIRDAAGHGFEGFINTYQELIRKVRNNKLVADDFAGTTVTITNPGTIGTVQSVPRLMEGQGLIVGVGAIDYPTAYQAADPRILADLGISKIITVSSTYDHRIIQGAESGMFLRRIHQLLTGADGFYEEIFRALGVPYEPTGWLRDTMPADRESAMLTKQVQVDALINMYRVRGHLIADLDPLALKAPSTHAELDPANYGLTIWDLDREFLASGLLGVDADETPRLLPLKEILGILSDAYTRTVGVDYMHIQDRDEKRWIQRRVEGVDNSLPVDDKLQILDRLNAAEALEAFLGERYIGQKRFGLEGAESAIPMIDAVLDEAADAGLESVVMGMAHRGRLNVLVNVVGKSYGQLFREFEGDLDEFSIQGSGDVKYHLGIDGRFTSRGGRNIDVHLAANPSHLEAVDPVVEGMARARMDQITTRHDYPVLALQIHGDAAFAGQGVVAETLNLSQIPGYRVGGTVHVVVNNQVGFTTGPEAARSSVYPSDVARMIQAPILHVNGDDPEACVRVARLAFAYRQRFNKDIVIDMWCYRRHGHNEGDDPSYTQPLMYKRIDSHRSVRKRYVESLVKRGDIDLEQAEAALDDFRTKLQTALDETRDAVEPAETTIELQQPVEPPDLSCTTKITEDAVAAVAEALTTYPEGFTAHPKLARQLAARAELFDEGQLDWAMAESLAFGSLLLEGTSVRLTGQDSRRGTFSHRHSTLVDYETGAEYRPLAKLASPGTSLWIYDSLLSEYAALGFEYGYSVLNKEALVIWEAQFGDFVNGAQIIIDQFLVSGEDKWGQTTGLVMLLPHGFEGQGPEHSSGRMERFLLLAAEGNLQVVNTSTAAQYFHVLRRQVCRELRKPLVVFTPKSLLRAREARSDLTEVTEGSFREVIDDPNSPDPEKVERIVLCTGKISHEAMLERDERGAAVAIVRVEQLYPWPEADVEAAVARYGNATRITWLQEEPENMGAWNYAKGHLFDAFGESRSVDRVSRLESGSPASGSAAVHAAEQADILERALS
jgi:2-oxoglutarate decarboxylase